MKVDITGYQADDIVSALNASCVDAEALLHNEDFIIRHEYMKPTLNRHIENCRAVQDQITAAFAGELPDKIVSMKSTYHKQL